MNQEHLLRRFPAPLLLALVACQDGGGSTTSATAAAPEITSASASGTATATTTDDAPTTQGDDDPTPSSGADETTSASGDDPTTTTTTTDDSTRGVSTTSEPSCGDGVIDPGEACDDGPQNGAGEACKADCSANVCGDGDVGPAEVCDLGDENGPDGGCSASCTINPSACGEQTYDASLEVLPVDIIFVVDNSGSMGDEIVGIQKNINQSFAQIIEGSGLNYRVILVSRHGPVLDQSICIEAPLSGIPEGGCKDPPPQPAPIPGKFYHYSVEIASHDALCLLASTFDGKSPDYYGYAPDGWQAWLREDAVKVFVAITDDNVSCLYDVLHLSDLYTVEGGLQVATKWDELIRALSPAHFGATPEARNFRFYSIVGLGYNDPPTAAWAPSDPILTGKCPTAASAGTGYQALSNLTGVIRFPLCDTSSYDQIFKAIAAGVIKWAKVACEFPMPTPPMGTTLDDDSIVVEYTPSDNSPPVLFDRVDGLDQCTPTGFYVDGDVVRLCPEPCAWVQKDQWAQIRVYYTCEPIDPG